MDAQTFFDALRHEGECWLWTGPTAGKGYGQLRVRRGNRRATYAHRYAYEVSKGPIPAGYQIDHLCRVKLCCRPEHLEAVTGEENNRRSDSLSARRGRQSQCQRGHQFDTANTYVTPDGRRQCRACSRSREQRRMRAQPRPAQGSVA